MKNRILAETSMFIIMVFAFTTIFGMIPNSYAHQICSGCPTDTSSTYCYDCNTEHNHELHSPLDCPSFPDGCNYCDEEEADRLICYYSGMVSTLEYSFESIGASADAGAEMADADGEPGEAGLLGKIGDAAWKAAKGVAAVGVAISEKVASKAAKAGAWFVAIESFVALEREYWDDLAEILYKQCRGCQFYVTRWQVNKGAHGWVTCRAARKDKSTTCDTTFRFCYRIKIGKPWCPNYDKHQSAP